VTIGDYEEQFTAFIDFLGFSETNDIDDHTRIKTLGLLTALSALRGNFGWESVPGPQGGEVIRIRPSISTFSDHIVISFPLGRMFQGSGDSKEVTTGIHILSTVHDLVTRIAASALRGFLGST